MIAVLVRIQAPQFGNVWRAGMEEGDTPWLLSGFCVLQGSAKVIRCLQSQRDKLSTVCKATLLDEEVRFSENIDFQYPMKQACVSEVEQFCDAVPHGDARVIRCLQVS